MKWCSVFKYYPPKNTPCFVMRKNGDIDVCIHDGSGWKNNNFTSDNYAFVYWFCIPDPTEIED